MPVPPTSTPTSDVSSPVIASSSAMNLPVRRASFRAVPALEDYALLGDRRTAALVSRAGSVDWWCVPRFDAPACFAALLGTPEHGRFSIAPDRRRVQSTRRYRPGHDGARDRARRPRPGGSASSTASRSGTRRPLLVRLVEGLEGSVEMRGRAHRALRLRLDRAVGAPRRRSLARDRRARTVSSSARRCDLHGRGHDIGARSSRSPRASRSRSCSAGSRRTIRGRFPTTRPRSSSDTTDVLANVVGALRVRGRVARAGVAFAAHARGADLRTDRRHRRRADHVAAGDARRLAQLGLPLLLGARRDAHARGVAHRRLPATKRCAGASGCCARRPAIPNDAADDVRRRRRAPAHRARARLAARATRARRPVRTGNGAHAQLQLDVYGELLDVLWQAARAGTPPSANSWSLARLLLDVARGALARARRRHLGGARSAPALHALEGDVLGRVRPRDRDGRAGRLRGSGRSVARDPRRDPRRGVRRRATTPSVGAFTQSLRLERARRVGADDPARRLPSRRRSRVSRRRSTCIRRELTDRRIRRALRPDGRERRRDRRARRRVPAVQLLDGRGARAGRRARRGARVVRAPARRSRTTSACSPRSTTRRRSACSATSRRRSRTSRSSRAAHTLAPERSPHRTPASRPGPPVTGARNAPDRNLRAMALVTNMVKGSSAQRLLLLVHGYGADEQDLGGLLPYLDPDGVFAAVMPRAPIAAPGTPGYMWYDMTGGGDDVTGQFVDRARRARRAGRRAVRSARLRSRGGDLRRLLAGRRARARARSVRRARRRGRGCVPRVCSR